MAIFGRDVALLCLVTLIRSAVECSSAANYKDQRLYKSGDVIVGGLFPIHLKKNGSSCSHLRSQALIWAETMTQTIDEINQNNTFLPNFTLGFDIRDTCSNEQAGIETAADFVYRNNLLFNSHFRFANHCASSIDRSNATRSPIVAVIGGEDTRVSMNVAQVLQLDDIPQVSYGATSAELSDPQFTSFFRTVPPDLYQSEAMADLVVHNNWTCVAVIGVDDGYGRSGVKAFMRVAKEKEICLVGSELFPVHDSEKKIREIVTKFKGMKHVEILILYSLPSQAARVFEEAVKQNLVGKTWIASDGWSESTYIQKPRFSPIIQGTLGFEFQKPRCVNLERHLLTNVSPQSHKTPWWGEFWKEEFNCSVNSSSVLYKPCTGQEKLTLDFYQNKLETALIAYVRDAVYVVAQALDVMSKCFGNSSGCIRAGFPVRPEDVLASMGNVSFKGLTGFLDFSKLKGEAQASYDIVNLQVDRESGAYKVAKVGKWDAKVSPKLELRDEQIQWRTGTAPRSSCGEVCKPGTYRSTSIECLWDCVPCDVDHISEIAGNTSCIKCHSGYIANAEHTKCTEVTVQSTRWNGPWGIALTVLTSLCIVVSLVTLVVTITFIKSPIFAETRPYLNILLLVETLGTYVFNFFQLFAERTDVYCCVLPFLFYLLYSSIIGTVLLKVHWIHLHVTPSQEQGAKRIGWKPYFIIALASLVPVFLSLLWIVIDPPIAVKSVESRLVVYEVCQGYQETSGLILRLFCVAYISIFVLLALVAAHRARSLPYSQKFHEAKHIAFAVTVLAISFATFYPGWYLIKGPVLAVFACVTNTAASTGTLFCLFIPKLNILFRQPSWNTRKCIRPASPEVRPNGNNTVLSYSMQEVATSSQTGQERTVRFAVPTNAS